MTDRIAHASPCPHCGSEMYPDFDACNAVKVFVCSKPTCLHRIYPDYPTRSGNQEMCYQCGEIFTVDEDCPGVLCLQCKSAMKRNRAKTHRPGGPHGRAISVERPTF